MPLQAYENALLECFKSGGDPFAIRHRNESTVIVMHLHETHCAVILMCVCGKVQWLPLDHCLCKSDKTKSRNFPQKS